MKCPKASARLRIGVAAAELKRAGHQNVFLNPQNSEACGHIDIGAMDVCIVPKFFFDSEFDPWFAACAAAKNGGRKLVVDICDSPFHKKSTVVAEFYGAVLKICDAVVVNSEKMAELIAPHSPRHAVVIEDAIIEVARKPQFAPGGTLRLLWFGHPSNIHFLRGWIDPLGAFARQRPCKLTIVTEEGCGAEQLAVEIQTHCAPALKAQFIPWSLESNRVALRNCDLVLIPSDPSNAFKAGASANRVAETLNAGRFPIASALPSYLPFSDSAWVGLELIEGIKWALANRGEVLARIRRGQALVSTQFMPQKIGGQWVNLIETLTGNARQ